MLKKELTNSMLKIERGYIVTKSTITNVVEDVFIAIGLTISIEQIQTILGIVILSVQILWIVVKTGIKIYQKIKEKRYGEIKEDIDTMTEEIKNVKDNVTKK